MSLKIEIINKSNNELPKYETTGASGMDLRANLEKDITLKPFERAIIPTGIYVNIPYGYEAQIRPRSGLAAKHGISVLNTPGSIDSDFLGQIQIILINFGDKDFVVKHNERIAQMVFAKVERVDEFIEVNIINKETNRNSEGFGTTGVK